MAYHSDYVGRQHLNAIFGDRVVGAREPDIFIQFQSELINVRPFNFNLHPGETMTFSAESASATEAFIGLD